MRSETLAKLYQLEPYAKTSRVSTFHYSYPDWDGSCDDELEIVFGE